ncbi:MAG: putative sulfoacetate exporter [Ignavibacteriae bacterium]|nr:MAG: putative sulfoacetate exporter [Ignavibacteriota bacterium]
MEELQISYFLLPLFFLIAFLFASVGHGGASGYLAIFAFAGIARSEIAPVVLIMNILVASNSFWNYYKAKYFSFKLLLPFVISSVPGAFIGGFIRVPSNIFSLLLGFALLLAALRLLFYQGQVISRWKDYSGKPFLYAIPIGFIIGILSGITGIGGGVFLSPFLLMSDWADAKQTSAVSAAFIALNSLAGLLGKAFHMQIHWEIAITLGIVVLIGGQLGSYLGANKFNPKILQKLLGVALIVASIKLLKDLIFI